MRYGEIQDNCARSKSQAHLLLVSCVLKTQERQKQSSISPELTFFHAGPGKDVEGVRMYCVRLIAAWLICYGVSTSYHSRAYSDHWTSVNLRQLGTESSEASNEEVILDPECQRHYGSVVGQSIYS